MKKSSDVIVLNGRHYDARSGKPLGGGVVHKPVRTEHRVKLRPATVSKTAHHHRPASHGPAKHVTAHAPEHSRTLMRQAVRKPSESSHRIKVHGMLSASGGRESSRIIKRSGHRKPNTARLQNPGTKRKNGQLISHFSPELFAVDGHTPAIVYGTLPLMKSTAGDSARHTASPATKPKETWTTDELLEYAVQAAEAPRHPVQHHRKTLLRRARAQQR